MKLMGIEEYSKVKHSLPYILSLKNKVGSLFYIGSRHTRNPKNKQISLFEKKFNLFNPKIVLTEGGKRPNIYTSKTQAVKLHGEMGLLTYLAGKQNIPLESLEIPFQEEIDKILKRYTKQEVFAFYCLRSLPYGYSWLKNEVKYFKKLKGWEKFDCTVKNLKEIHKKIFKKELKKDRKDFYLKATSPVEEISILNKLSIDSNKIRDTFMVKKIIKEVKRHKRVLAIVGASHVVMQEKSLKEHFK